MKFKFKSIYFIAVLGILAFLGCEDLQKYELPEAGSIADLTPPEANFSATQGEGSADEWKNYTFSNLSTSATSYAWDFGDGNTSTDLEPSNTYPGEGTFTVSLTATDNLGVSNTLTQDIIVEEPPLPAVPNPVLVNDDFVKLPKNNGNSSDCTCSGWDNDDIGEQGESSSGNGSDVVKFDNNEPDHVYQEFEVVPNADYKITVVVQFKAPASGSTATSMLEYRVLAGSGYNSGYTPTYYPTAVEFPNSGYGYTTVAQVETAANNLMVETLMNPGDEGYNTYIYTFNSGANSSVALFVRGLGGGTTGSYGYNSGNEEVRMDSVLIESL